MRHSSRRRHRRSFPAIVLLGFVCILVIIGLMSVDFSTLPGPPKDPGPSIKVKRQDGTTQRVKVIGETEDGMLIIEKVDEKR